MCRMIKLLLFSFSLLFASITSAGDFLPADVKPYVGGGFGTYLIGNGTGAQYVGGGYGMLGLEVMPNFALEIRAGRTLYAKSAAGNEFGTQRFVSYLARVQAKRARFNWYGLIGVSKIKAWSSGSPTVNEFSFSFGGGVEMNVYKNMMIGIEGLILDGNNRATSVPFAGNFLGTLGATGRILF